MKTILSLVVLLCLSWLITPVRAHEDTTLYNVVNLQAEAEMEVTNDEMIVVLVSQHEGSEASRIAEAVNKDMDWALQRVRQSEAIDSKTRNYQTHPVYNKQLITGWRASQEVELRSKNITALTALVGDLQEKLQVRNIHFRPTDKSRKQSENELIEKALVAFRERVAIVKKHMNNSDYTIINLNINTNGFMPPVRHERTAMKTMAMDAAPAVEAGTSSVSVTVSGSVQFYR